MIQIKELYHKVDKYYLSQMNFMIRLLIQQFFDNLET